MIDSHDNKGSPQNQDVRIKTEFTPTHTLRTPTPRTYNGKKYYCATDVAKIIGVDRSRVVRWNNELWHGAQWFTADLKTHDGVYLYEIERVINNRTATPRTGAFFFAIYQKEKTLALFLVALYNSLTTVH